ncbi:MULTISPECIES: hypothetical protein [Rhodococcus]|uniref:hypothetical protein n=1 Tax=Rhodococcus TaxID=1827 RepID=UPI001E425E24|nr:hypothetical protein [Rhodococcus pyridinivorans]MCD2118320.1 hypothetical protein [Rhodococcus pyridinivorans]MCZ4627253.1 hypothetical protein [Rhodococcus pyridinivorans]MCZ4648445.1 hypothetical protein [Rhodococcus pyridinivorans]MDJ0481120.1 hypothetical protein [Rhodococcus pyridinivorans]MDV7254586.1 hypothetical protein [Rhodococcus pyridinivorans]
MTNTASTEYRHSASLTSTAREATRHNDVHDADLGLWIPIRYRHDWALFADWCAAADHRPIPATPDTLALFLHEHPAATSTQRRRLSAINAVHTGHGYPAPGRTETVRRHLDTTRASRVERLGQLLLQRAAELPTTGWPSGLFGRRDALLLVLAATGMTFTDLTRLRRRDLRLDSDTLVVTTRAGERFRLAPDPETGDNPAAAIYQRWAQIQAFLDQHPGTHLLRHHLTEATTVVADPLDAEQARQPLLCPIDRWGHLPHAQSMTPQSVSVLVRAHLSGRAPVRKALPVPPQGDIGALVESDVILDSGYYERGITARRRDHEALEDLTDVFGEIEQRADALLDELLAVLENL